jgi:triosephosphate isomerase
MKKKRIVVANWKMNPPTLAEAKKIFSQIKRLSSTVTGSLVVCPPAVYINPLASSYSGKKISFGAQDVAWQEKGPFTGSISATQLESSGVSYVIVGHSERRAMTGETADIVAKKVTAAVGAGLQVVLCIGEQVRDADAKYLVDLKEELKVCLRTIDKVLMKHILIAYEPVWAVGAREAMLPSDIHGMTIYLRKVLTEMYDKAIADATPILYGGAVTSENVEDIIKNGEVEGLLVGRESLNPKGIMYIVQVANGK